MDDEQRAGDVLEHAPERQGLRSLERFGLVARLGVEDVAALRQRIELRPALGEVVRSGKRDDRAESLLLRGRPRSVDPAHADAHQADATQIHAEVRRREVIEQWRDDGRPVRADREPRRVLTLPGPVDRQRREAAAEEIVLHRVQLFLHGVQTRYEDRQRRAFRRAARSSQDARDHRAFERRLDAASRRIDARHGLRVGRHRQLAQLVMQRAGAVGVLGDRPMLVADAPPGRRPVTPLRRLGEHSIEVVRVDAVRDEPRLPVARGQTDAIRGLGGHLTLQLRRDVGEEARRISAIRDAVVDGERERDDRSHRRSAIRRDDAIRDAADGEDRRLRWIDDRREAIDAERAEIRDGDRRAAERVGACATRADRCLERLAFFPQSGK